MHAQVREETVAQRACATSVRGKLASANEMGRGLYKIVLTLSAWLEPQCERMLLNSTHLCVGGLSANV